MKIIKGFEGETLEVSDFGEWVGKDYIDYKFEYENNQKVIKELFKENQKQKEIIDKIIKLYKHRLNTANEFIESRKENMILEHYEDLKYILNDCDLESSW